MVVWRFYSARVLLLLEARNYMDSEIQFQMPLPIALLIVKTIVLLLKNDCSFLVCLSKLFWKQSKQFW